MGNDKKWDMNDIRRFLSQPREVREKEIRDSGMLETLPVVYNVKRRGKRKKGRTQ